MRANGIRGVTIIIAAALLAGGCGGCGKKDGEDGKATVLLCDGHTSVDIPAGQAPTRETGQATADALMAQWRQQNPGRDWEADERRSHRLVPPADNRHILTGDQKDSQTYGQYSERDILAWARATELSALAGSRVFHSAEELGSTIAVSCDMCHPDGANTHPETYPKFQPQMGRVVLLRDMINWCLEHPVRAPPKTADDPRMRAMEAYILAQRKGVALEYGKH
jgi:hypothetical protein